MKKRCKFLGGAGLEERFRPTSSPCLGEFELSCHPTGGQNRIYCDVCRPFAMKAKEHAKYLARRKEFAKKNRAKHWKRVQAAGRVYRPLTGMWRCQYRDEHGKRGEGCLLKFKPKNARQKYCSVCKKLALARVGKKWRKDHAAEITARASLQFAALRAAAKDGKILADLKEKPVTWQKIVALLRINPNLTNDQVQLLAGTKLSMAAMNRVRRYAGVPGPGTGTKAHSGKS